MATMQFSTSVRWLLLALTWSQCECVITASPQRLEYGQRADFNIEVDQSRTFATKLAIYAKFVNENGGDAGTRTLMTFTSPQCSAVGDVTILECDVIRMQFKIIARNLQNIDHFTYHASVSIGSTLKITFKRPNKVEIVSNAEVFFNNVTLNENDEFGMLCRVVGGWNHEADFGWYATTECSPTPNAKIETRVSSWSNFRDDGFTYLYSDIISSCSTNGIRVIDRGDYYCQATYDPRSVGVFRSQTVHIHVPGQVPPELIAPWILYTVGGIAAFVAIVVIVVVSVIIRYKCCRRGRKDGNIDSGNNKKQNTGAGRKNSIAPESDGGSAEP